MTDGPNVTHVAAEAADFTHLKLACFCFSVYALAPSLAHWLLITTLCGEAGIISLNTNEESKAQRSCVTWKRSHSPQVAKQSLIDYGLSDAFLGQHSYYKW